MKVTTNSLITKNKAILENEIDGEKIMMSLDTGRYYGLNKVASRIWEIVNNSISVEKLIELLLNEYEIDYEECKKEVLKFLDILLKKKLILILK